MTIKQKISRGIFSILTVLPLAGCFAPTVAVDSEQYVEGTTGIATIKNADTSAIYLPGCEDFVLEQLVDNDWVVKGPNKICVQAGNARPIVDPSQIDIEFNTSDPGIYRLNAKIGYDCDENQPLSESDCEMVKHYFSPEFEVSPDSNVLCMVGGCSGQACSSDSGLITTCEWKAEYTCYQFATCSSSGSNLDNKCGWVMTPELTQCIKDARLSEVFELR